MHSAPAVEYPVGRCRLCGYGLMCLLTLWLSGLLLWWWAVWWRWPPGAWWCAVVLGGALSLAWRWVSLHPTEGVLHWQLSAKTVGEWWWCSAAYRRGTPLVQLRVALDVQNVLLLRGRTAAGLTLWLWLHAADMPEHWTALRSALRSHAKP